MRCTFAIADQSLPVDWCPLPNGYAAALNHEACHWDDDWTALQDTANSLNDAGSFPTRASCNLFLSQFNIATVWKAFIGDPHADPKYRPGGACFSEAEWRTE